MFRTLARRTAAERANVTTRKGSVYVTAPYVSYGAGAATITDDTARALARREAPAAVLLQDAPTWRDGGSHHVWRFGPRR